MVSSAAGSRAAAMPSGDNGRRCANLVLSLALLQQSQRHGWTHNTHGRPRRSTSTHKPRTGTAAACSACAPLGRLKTPARPPLHAYLTAVRSRRAPTRMESAASGRQGRQTAAALDSFGVVTESATAESPVEPCRPQCCPQRPAREHLQESLRVEREWSVGSSLCHGVWNLADAACPRHQRWC